MVGKKWRTTAAGQYEKEVQIRKTLGGQFMLEAEWGRELLQKSKLIRRWTEKEERLWMQMVGRVFPVQSYLKRVGLAPTAACQWCGKDVKETQDHFMSVCPTFEKHRTKVHNKIVAAILQSGCVCVYVDSLSAL
eukprot:3776014-Rhodomonas_salina.1